MEKRDVHLFWTPIPLEKEILPKIKRLFWPEDSIRPFIGEGALAKEFEQKCADKFGFDYVLFTNSGTSALSLALLGADINKDDEVITTPLTCTATNLPIIGRQAKPVFADVQYETGNIDPKDIEKRITKKTKAIMVVHWGGYPCNMEEINQISKKYEIPIIADCAHALGATYQKESIAKFADYSMFSLQAIKQMTTVDGGLLALPFKNSRKDLVKLCQDPQVGNTLRSVFGKKITEYFEKDPDVKELPKDYFVEEIFTKITEQPNLRGDIIDNMTKNYDDFVTFWKEWQKAESLKRMRWFGIGRDERAPAPGKGYFAYPTTEPGGKYHANNLNALIGLTSLDHLNKWQQRRDEIAQIYNEELKNVKGVKLFEQKEDRKSGNWLYNIHVEKRSDFVGIMQKKGIECSIVHERNDILPIFRADKKGVYKNLDKINEDRICIPLHQNMSEKDVDYVIESIKSGW